MSLFNSRGRARVDSDPELEAQAAMAGELRRQIAERVQAQHQLLLLAAAIAGATASFGTRHASSHAAVLALLCVLFVGFALATLRQDQEVTILASHLLDVGAFGSHATAQAAWEQHRFRRMQAGNRRFVVSTAVTIGVYGVPVLGALAYAGAAISAGPSAWVIILLGFAAVLATVFLLGALQVAAAYQALGNL